mmetsp:Transcript_29503/g.57862  ORF Transcript_29503/g.57862 Transcript_29503/m.57862 type:complete len:191 (-) Transcript_29503:83-655(-)
MAAMAMTSLSSDPAVCSFVEAWSVELAGFICFVLGAILMRPGLNISMLAVPRASGVKGIQNKPEAGEDSACCSKAKGNDSVWKQQVAALGQLLTEAERSAMPLNETECSVLLAAAAASQRCGLATEALNSLRPGPATPALGLGLMRSCMSVGLPREARQLYEELVQRGHVLGDEAEDLYDTILSKEIAHS